MRWLLLATPLALLGCHALLPYEPAGGLDQGSDQSRSPDPDQRFSEAGGDGTSCWTEFTDDFSAQQMITNFFFMLLRVSADTDKTNFFCTEKENANTATWLTVHLANHCRCSHHRTNTGTIIDCTSTFTPGIKMGAHDEIIIGSFTSGDLTDDIRANNGPGNF